MQALPTSGVRVEFDVPATMRDGTILRANVFRPDDGGAGAYPVLLTRTPYGKDLPLGASGLPLAQIARLGYVVVVQDVRGCFSSEGEWYPFLNEGADGADTVAWAAALPGANGRVGTFGGSYVGFTQWAAAREGAPAVGAMAPAITWADGEVGVLWRGGALELGIVGSWNMLVGIDKLLRRHRGQPQELGRAMYQLAREYDALPTSGYGELPLEGFGPLARLGLDAPVTTALQQREDEAFRAPLRVADAYATVNVPALHVGGWYDIFLGGTIKNFQGMRAAGRQGQYLIIGPWSHGMFDQVVGDVGFGLASSGAFLDLQSDLATLHARFFDRWLKDASNGFERWPAVKYFVMGANIWRSSEMWPPAGSEPTPWYLHSQGHANTAEGDGELSPARPVTEPADQFVYDPAHPVPTVGGATLMHPTLRAGAIDQRRIELRPDMLVYTSAPLEQPVEVAGPVSVVLYAASDAPDTDFVARLVDVSPDGTAIPLTDGIIRMRYRAGGGQAAAPLDPGQAYEVAIDLWATACVFLPGHRIRLDVTSSSFPRWERNLNTGQPNGAATEMRSALQAVLHDEAHPSHIVLPIARR
ncbi:MAG TPA: CocE/NonD family hydrolase [Ktedonobacterales bacterium]